MQPSTLLLYFCLFLSVFADSLVNQVLPMAKDDDSPPLVKPHASYDDGITLKAAGDLRLFSNADSSGDKFAQNARYLDPENFIITGSGGIVSAGVVANFTIQPMDQYGHAMDTTDLQLLLRHNMSEKHSKFVTRCEEQYCVVYYICIEAGNYFMNLLLNDVQVGGGPINIRIHPGPVNATRTFSMALDHSGKPVHPLLRRNEQFVTWEWHAGETNIFTINPRDSYGNKVHNFDYRSLSFSHNLSASAPLKMKSEALSDGRLKVIANTTSTVPLRLSVLYKNTPILNSPIEISVLPGDVCYECSILQGNGLIDTSVGKQSEIIVLVRDKWYNANPNGFVSATCHSPNCSLAIENHEDGSFSVLFTPYKKEIIQISVRVNGFPIIGSPFSSQVKAKEFPLPPIVWKFLGPFDSGQCIGSSEFPLEDWGLCDYDSFKKKVVIDHNVIYPSALMIEGTVSWRTIKINATGHSRIKTGGTEFFGWAVGDFDVSNSGEYNVFCGGIYEYYIKDIPFSGGSWHPLILEEGMHSITLLLTSEKGVGEYYCDFMPVVEEATWPVEAIIDGSSLPADQSWFALIQLVILFKCLQAIVGPLYYNPARNAE